MDKNKDTNKKEWSKLVLALSIACFCSISIIYYMTFSTYSKKKIAFEKGNPITGIILGKSSSKVHSSATMSYTTYYIDVKVDSKQKSIGISLEDYDNENKYKKGTKIKLIEYKGRYYIQGTELGNIYSSWIMPFMIFLNLIFIFWWLYFTKDW